MCTSNSDRFWRQLLAGAGQPDSPIPKNEAEQVMADLYGAFARGNEQSPTVFAHLGQSIDGFVATASGDSYYVTGPANLDHLHRMRALADAIIVGAGTIAADDPALTTRRVSGDSPGRVILDGRRRLSRSHRVFSDGAAPTLLVCADVHASPATHGDAEVLAMPATSERFRVSELVTALTERGMYRIFVEGGGDVVSGFLAAGVLHRLHLTVAPVMIGDGRRGLRAPAHEKLSDCLRPAHRLFPLGDDVLFDYDLSASGNASSSQ